MRGYMTLHPPTDPPPALLDELLNPSCTCKEAEGFGKRITEDLGALGEVFDGCYLVPFAFGKGGFDAMYPLPTRAQYPRGGTGTRSVRHTFPNRTADMP